MATKPETKFITRVNSFVSNAVYRWKTHDSFTPGIPDLYYSGPKSYLWAEYKWYAKQPKILYLGGGKRPKLTKIQANWLTCRYDEGRNVCVIVGWPEGGIILFDRTWEDPHVLSKKSILSDAEIGQWISKECIK